MAKCTAWMVVFVLCAVVVVGVAPRGKRRHLPPELSKLDNLPVFHSPLGACEVGDLSLKRVKKELQKRGTECVTCKEKRDYQLALIDTIELRLPILTDEEYDILQSSPDAPWQPDATYQVADWQNFWDSLPDEAPLTADYGAGLKRDEL